MKWIPITKETLPPADHGDYPKEYIVRGKGDDPRSGWVSVEFRTAEQMIYYSQGFDRAEYLDESPDSNQQDQEEAWMDVLNIADRHQFLGNKYKEVFGELKSKYTITKKQ